MTNVINKKEATEEQKKKRNGQDKQKAQNKISVVNPNTSVTIISTNGLKASVEDKL